MTAKYLPIIDIKHRENVDGGSFLRAQQITRLWHRVHLAVLALRSVGDIADGLSPRFAHDCAIPRLEP